MGILSAFWMSSMGTTLLGETPPGIVESGFIFEEAPFAECHASTIEESNGVLVAAWFGGTRESHKDVGIWVSRNYGVGWSEPVQVATGIQHQDKRYPCWNPVLFQPRNGPLMLYYKVGPSPEEWWGMVTTSVDGGKTWSEPNRLPEDILGPIKNKPIQLHDGGILSPSSTEDNGWQVHLEYTTDLGETWKIIGPLETSGEIGVIQPTVLQHSRQKLQILCRSQQNYIAQSWSDDGGMTWEQITLSTLPNPNAGIDAVTLENGRHLLVYNHTTDARTPLNLAVSDDGRKWQAATVLESTPGEYSYPAVIQTADGLVHITYTWKRQRVKHVVVKPSDLQLEGMPEGNWPE